MIAQDKTLHLDQIEINNFFNKPYDLNQSLDSREISNSNSEDVGGLLQKFTGITVKNYGGAGAAKTFSFRGISGTHTGIVLDGFLIQNNQIGQVDLSTLPIENLQYIKFVNGLNNDELAPVSAMNLGNYLSLSSFESTFPKEDLSIRSHTKFGSFGYLDNYFAIKQRLARSFYAISGKYRFYRGDFDYTYKNGNQLIHSNRMNNDLNDGGILVTFGTLIGSGARILTTYQNSGFSKGLPGPVILYNGLSNQRLKSNGQSLNSEYILCRKNFSSKFYISVLESKLLYNDPSFLNKSQNYSERYFNRSIQLGNSSKYVIKDSILKLIVGAEHSVSDLQTMQSIIGVPKRLHTQFSIGLTGLIKTLNYTIQYGRQFARNSSIDRVSSYEPWTTMFIVETVKTFKWIGAPRVWFKKTYRLPSFGELYYNQIGNNKLNPELVYQSNIGSTFKVSKINTEIAVDVYKNFVEDKIVAIPTKNLFVWSIQNVGKVEVSGLDLNMTMSSVVFRSKSIIKLGYSYQSVVDISNFNSPTYGHQIAYLPKHSFHSEIVLNWKDRFQFGYTVLFNSIRYSLNENIAFNEVSSFFVSDIFLNQVYSIKKNQLIKIGVSIKNCFNSSYESIRSYAMPGRNYLLSINYAFN